MFTIRIFWRDAIHSDGVSTMIASGNYSTLWQLWFTIKDHKDVREVKIFDHYFNEMDPMKGIVPHYITGQRKRDG